MQRYDREPGLPTPRVAGKALSAVVAVQAEFDDWVNSSPTRVYSRQNPQSFGQANEYGESEFSGKLTPKLLWPFPTLSWAQAMRKRKRHTTRSAREAYDTIIRLREGGDLSAAKSDKLEANLQRLKGKLEPWPNLLVLLSNHQTKRPPGRNYLLFPSAIMASGVGCMPRSKISERTVSSSDLNASSLSSLAQFSRNSVFQISNWRPFPIFVSLLQP